MRLDRVGLLSSRAAESESGCVEISNPGLLRWMSEGRALSGWRPACGRAALRVTAEGVVTRSPELELDALDADSFGWWLGHTASDPGWFGRDATHIRRGEAAHWAARLDPEEWATVSRVGLDLGIALTQAAFQARPGLRSCQIAGMLSGILWDLGSVPVRLEVAADHRLQEPGWLHPGGEPIQRVVSFAALAARDGLHILAGRTVLFGEPEDAILEYWRDSSGEIAGLVCQPERPATRDVCVALGYSEGIPADAPAGPWGVSFRGSGPRIAESFIGLPAAGDPGAVRPVVDTPDLPACSLWAHGVEFRLPGMLLR